MSSLCVTFILLACVSWSGLVAAKSSAPVYELEDAEVHFEQFMQKFDKSYSDENEKSRRFEIFKEHLKEINRKNERSQTAEYGITQFADLTNEEFDKYYKGLGKKSSNILEPDPCGFLEDADVHYDDAPESFDWRDKNAVTEVKDQNWCGSCYAFSAVGSIESAYAIKYKQLVDLSEQQILDCDESNMGCMGGWMSNVFQHVIQLGGIMTESDYKYTAERAQCKFVQDRVRVKLANCQSYNLTSQEKLKQVLYHNGPISIALDSNGLVGYEKGIVTDDFCSTSIDHGVLLVGYGTENDVPYWIIKNSWTKDFGEQGYFRLLRGEKAISCGIMNEFMASAIL